MIDYTTQPQSVKFAGWRNLTDWLDRGSETAAPLGDLLLRLWMANAFWVLGLHKLQNWSSTWYLFENEYSVPLLEPELAARLDTAVELAGPVLLALGLGGCLAGLLLFLIVLCVSRRWSLDHLVRRFWLEGSR